MTKGSQTLRAAGAIKRASVPTGFALLLAGVGAAAFGARSASALLAGTGLVLASVGALWIAKPPRAVIAFAVSPAAAGLLLFALTGNAFTLVLVGGAYPPALVLGVPAYLAMRRYHYLGAASVVLVATLLACAAGIFFANGVRPELLLFGGFGALAGLVFWIIISIKPMAALRFRSPTPRHEA